MTDAETIALYDAQAAEYDATISKNVASDSLRAFFTAMPKGARVLDLGCGPGTASLFMMRAGINVDPVDASAGMVRTAETRGLPARQATFDEITETSAYDGIWANFSLTHADRSALPRHLAALHRAAKPGARLHLGMKTGIGDMRDRLGRHYCLVTVPELIGLTTAAGFTPTETREGIDKGFAGTADPYVILTAYA